jgi:hypothetical protein
MMPIAKLPVGSQTNTARATGGTALGKEQALIDSASREYGSVEGICNAIKNRRR